MGFSVMPWGAEKLVPAEYWCPYGTHVQGWFDRKTGTHVLGSHYTQLHVMYSQQECWPILAIETQKYLENMDWFERLSWENQTYIVFVKLSQNHRPILDNTSLYTLQKYPSPWELYYFTMYFLHVFALCSFEEKKKNGQIPFSLPYPHST